MPAPAVIPAPIAYINAAAVKGFVVEFRVVRKFAASAVFHPNSVIDGAGACGSRPSLARRMLSIEEVDIT